MTIESIAIGALVLVCVLSFYGPLALGLWCVLRWLKREDGE